MSSWTFLPHDCLDGKPNQLNNSNYEKGIISHDIIVARLHCSNMVSNRAARREALKKEREARRALEAQQDSIAYFKAVEALKTGSFVLEADNVTFPNGITRYVSGNTNYVQVDNGEGIVQTAFTNFSYNPSPNGLGGVTVQGNISGLQMKEDKHGNYFYNYTIQPN